MKFAEFLSNMISEKETLQMDPELRHCQTDSSLQLFENKSLMTFWNKMIELKEGNIKKYFIFSKMIVRAE